VTRSIKNVLITVLRTELDISIQQM